MSQAAGWLHAIPGDWQRKKLKYVASLKSGDSITSDDIAESGEYPVFGGNGIRGYASAYTHCGRHVLIGRQGALCGNINYATGCFWASEHAVVAAINAEADVTWLGELLRSMNLNQYSQSAAQPGLAVDVIANLEIPVPPFRAQRAIADYLDRETARLDALVAAKERVLGLLAEKRRALITRAVTRGLPAEAAAKAGLDPSPPLRESGIPWLGEIPAHWAATRLKFVAEVRGGFSLGKNYGSVELVEYSYLRVANVQDGHLDLSDVTSVLLPNSEAMSWLLEVGDVLMNEGGDADKLGRGCIWRGEVVSCLHQNHVFSVRPRLVTSEWLNAWTSTEGAKSYFESRAKQSTNLASISATNIRELPLPLPPTREQRAIVAHISAETAKLDTMRSATERTIALLKERRAALIAAAVTGQIDVGSGGYYTDNAASQKEPGRRL